MLEFLASTAEVFIGEECATVLVRQLNVLDPTCLKLAISRGLSLGVVAGATLVKASRPQPLSPHATPPSHPPQAPQIGRIYRAGSAEGVSVSVRMGRGWGRRRRLMR